MLTLHNRPPRRPRCAYSLLELLVVMAIIAILLALSMGAVTRALDAARRTVCSNNLRQLAIGMHEFRDHFEFFPSNGGYKGGDAGPDLRTDGMRWGVADPRKGGLDQPGPWGYSILPGIGEDSAYDGPRYDGAAKWFACPSRRNGKPQVCPANDPVNVGNTMQCNGINPWTKTDYVANTNIIPNRGGKLATIETFTDGLGHTILLGEKSIDPRCYNTGSWYWDEPMCLGGNGGNGRNGTTLQRDVPGVGYANNWGGSHAGGCQFAFGDGSVRTLKYGLPASTMGALLSAAAGDNDQGK